VGVGKYCRDGDREGRGEGGGWRAVFFGSTWLLVARTVKNETDRGEGKGMSFRRDT